MLLLLVTVLTVFILILPLPTMQKLKHFLMIVGIHESVSKFYVYYGASMVFP